MNLLFLALMWLATKTEQKCLYFNGNLPETQQNISEKWSISDIINISDIMSKTDIIYLNLQVHEGLPLVLASQAKVYFDIVGGKTSRGVNTLSFM